MLELRFGGKSKSCLFAELGDFKLKELIALLFTNGFIVFRLLKLEGERILNYKFDLSSTLSYDKYKFESF